MTLKVNWKSKRITLGLTGGIAIYKSAALLRRLVNELELDVSVIMTDAAQQFMSPRIFETFSGKAVVTGMFARERVATRHIDLGSDADLVLVCPATANIIAKAAHGIADDILSTVILVAGPKTVFAPAMNSHMYLNPVTQANIGRLEELGYGFIAPESGALACNDDGPGRLADESRILEIVQERLRTGDQLRGKRVVVTAGPTREYLDPVRFISNRSSGKMGYALAVDARRRGADVVLISGPSHEIAPPEVQIVNVESAKEMGQALMEQGKNADYLFMAAAVEDIVPANPRSTKLKKGTLPDSIAITRSTDLVSEYRRSNPDCCIVAFSVEMEDGRQRSLEKLRTKGADYIVWNNPAEPGSAFGTDTNAVLLIAADGQEWQFPLASKRTIAARLIEQILGHRKEA